MLDHPLQQVAILRLKGTAASNVRADGQVVGHTHDAATLIKDQETRDECYADDPRIDGWHESRTVLSAESLYEVINGIDDANIVCNSQNLAIDTHKTIQDQRYEAPRAIRLHACAQLTACLSKVASDLSRTVKTLTFKVDVDAAEGDLQVFKCFTR